MENEVRFKDWLAKVEEVSTATDSIAGFARPTIGGSRRMYPKPLVMDINDERKDRKKDM